MANNAPIPTQPTDPEGKTESLGERLREIRNDRHLSLRELSRQSGIASGYLSQLERGEVNQPTPSTLDRLAKAYEMPVTTLMRWAGYDIGDASQPTDTQLARAMSLIGPNPSSTEVDALDALFKILRGRAGFSAPHVLDRPLDVEERAGIRDYAMRLLREAGALDDPFPTNLEHLMAIGKLVYAGEIELTADERRSLRQRFGSSLKGLLDSLEGLIGFGSNEIWLKPGLHHKRSRFVTAHEVGHHILPVHRELAYLDTKATLAESVRDACEREANQAAIELLAQGDRLRAMCDDSKFCAETVSALADAADISLQATARRVAEESKRLTATVTYYKGWSGLMDPHIYPSAPFEDRFGWSQSPPELAAMHAAFAAAAATGVPQSLTCQDVGGRDYALRCEAIDTPKALIGLVAKDPGGPVGAVITVRRRPLVTRREA